MTIDQATKLLSEMYKEGKARREAVTYVHLFGIRHAEALASLPLKEIAIRAGVSAKYQTEIRKGINLARHVAERL